MTHVFKSLLYACICFLAVKTSSFLFWQHEHLFFIARTIFFLETLLYIVFTSTLSKTFTKLLSILLPTESKHFMFKPFGTKQDIDEIWWPIFPQFLLDYRKVSLWLEKFTRISITLTISFKWRFLFAFSLFKISHKDFITLILISFKWRLLFAFSLFRISSYFSQETCYSSRN